MATILSDTADYQIIQVDAQTISFVAKPGSAFANQATIQQAAANALNTNTTFLALGAPTNAQTVAQVQALSRQVDGLIRYLLGRFDTTT